MTPWSKTFSVTAESGRSNNFELRVPPRGTIAGVTLVQESGALNGCHFELFTSRRAAPPNTDGSSASSADVGIAAENYAVFAASQAIANGQNAFRLRGQLVPYMNRDGDPSNMQYRLYLQLTPGGTPGVMKDFTFSLDILGNQCS